MEEKEEVRNSRSEGRAGQGRIVFCCVICDCLLMPHAFTVNHPLTLHCFQLRSYSSSLSNSGKAFVETNQ